MTAIIGHIEACRKFPHTFCDEDGFEITGIAGLPYTLERFPRAEVLWAVPQRTGVEARRLQASLIDVHIQVTAAQTTRNETMTIFSPDLVFMSCCATYFRVR